MNMHSSDREVRELAGVIPVNVSLVPVPVPVPVAANAKFPDVPTDHASAVLSVTSSHVCAHATRVSTYVRDVTSA